ncbi:MAG: DUF1688 family protein, partial [Lautropia sp.]|nr:DUF1688 family protein [Lautropia sp.]
MPAADRAAALARLRSPALIRTRCRRILDAVAAGRSSHFRFEPARLSAAADLVADITRRRYPNLAVPYHSRWRHFEAGGIDRHTPLRLQLLEQSGGDQRFAARSLVDLAVVSVLLDAGAGAAWTWQEDGTGMRIGRSEGLALASLQGFRAGVFSSLPGEPLRADAARLQGIDEADLAAVFQVSGTNPLVGLAGRTRLLNALGAALARLRSPALIRTRCRRILDAVAAGRSSHFRFEPARLSAAADLVA